MKYGWICFWFI